MLPRRMTIPQVIIIRTNGTKVLNKGRNWIAFNFIPGVLGIYIQIGW